MKGFDSRELAEVEKSKDTIDRIEDIEYPIVSDGYKRKPKNPVEEKRRPDSLDEDFSKQGK